MLSRVDPALRQPQALCVCPTRELAAQNLAVVERIGKYTGITVTSTVDDPSAPARCETCVDRHCEMLTVTVRC